VTAAAMNALGTELNSATAGVAANVTAISVINGSVAANTSAIGANTAAIATKQPKIMTGNCTTALATRDKTVTLDAPWDTYTPIAGDRLDLKFTNGSSISFPTLAVNGGAAKSIVTVGGGVSNTLVVGAGSVMTLRYSGTQWESPVTTAPETVVTAAALDAGTATTFSYVSANILGPYINAKQPKIMTGTCTTAVGTAAKTVTLDAPWNTYTPVDKDRIDITFTNGCITNATTLAVNGGPARAITTPLGSSTSLLVGAAANSVLSLRYNATLTRWESPATNGPSASVTAAELDAGSLNRVSSVSPDVLGPYINAKVAKHTGNALVQEWVVAFGGVAIALTNQPIPTGAVAARVTIIPGGNGGGSGRRGAAGTVRCGGGGGASNPSLGPHIVFDVGSATTWGLALGVPGAGGAAVTTDDTNGNPGAIAGLATFTMGTLTIRWPQLGGNGLNGGGGTATSGQGGGILTSSGGLNCAGGSASNTGGVGGSGGHSYGLCGSGGGSGGGITAANVANNGGPGGVIYVYGPSYFGPLGGVVDGAAPQTGAAAAGLGIYPTPGQGGGGGAASITTAAQAGADGLGYGAAGAGGGASLNGFNSGRGGNGGPAYARVEWLYG
jgi:hypothetical protein